MKFVVNKTKFEEALDIVSRAINTRSTLPVLNNVLIKCEQKQLKLATTNLEIAIETALEADIKEEGIITIPVKLMLNYISLLEDEEVEISTEDSLVLKFKSENSNTIINGIDPKEFPLIPQIKEETSFKIKNNELQDLISKTVFASAMDEIKPVLAGILFKIENKKVYVVATDSYRLVEKITNSKETNKDIQIIIPSKTVLELSRIIQKIPNKEINIKIANNQITFETEGIYLTSRLIEGKYPDYKQIIPEKSETLVEVDTTEFIKTVKRVNLFAKESANSVKMEVKKDRILIIADTAQIGREEASIKVKTIGEEKKIAFNAQFLLDALMNVGEETVVMGINTELSPVILRPKSEDDYLHIIMPLKI